MPNFLTYLFHLMTLHFVGGLMFMPNVSHALDAIRRTLSSGSRLAISVWDEPTKVPFVNLPMKIAREDL